MNQQPNTPGDQQSIGDQLADILIKVIKPGGMTCGGLVAFWFLVVQSDIPRSIASAAIGIMLSYGAKFFEPIHKGNQQRATRAGDNFNQGIDYILKYLTDKATGGTPEDRYLACQALDCQAVETEGTIQYDSIFTPLLSEVFVSLSIDSKAKVPGYGAKLYENLSDGLKVWDYLGKSRTTPTFQKLAILAWGGSGKTTLLKHIAFCYGSRQTPRSAPNLIPFLLILRKHKNKILSANAPNLPTLITKHHIPGLPSATDLQMPFNWAESVLKQGRAIVMLDGFDEVPKEERVNVARWVNQQMRRYSKSVFILTSRPKAYTEQHLITNVPEERIELSRLWVRDFSAQQREDFVEKWYLCQLRYANGARDTPDVYHKATHASKNLLDQIEARDELKALAKNPLLLNMIVTFHRRNPWAELPQRRVELYKEICQLQLKDRPKARALEALLTECETQTILQRLAIYMMSEDLKRIHHETLLNELKEILTDLGETVEASVLLEEIEQISELLVKQEDEYEFAHLSFQEYLASVHLAKNYQTSEQDLYDKLDNDWWKPTILLYAAQINPTTLIQEALNRGAIDLAYQCLQELPRTKRIDPQLKAQLLALKQAVQTSRYAQLETYLKAGQWKEADEETYRLMITTVGKEEGQSFDKEELLNFPCEELLTIDGLWVKHSNGKFGFSVQNEIYLECGGIPDGKYNKKAYNKYYAAVGWNNVKFDIKSPIGHLPLGPSQNDLVVSTYRGVSYDHSLIGPHWQFSSLASRLVKCKA